MPNKQAAKKALRQTKKHAILNQARRDAYKNAIKKALKANSAEAIQAAQKALDKAAKRGVIAKNAAARKLSRLMKKLHAAKTSTKK
jgi:small subunit ribosomal protein S20